MNIHVLLPGNHDEISKTEQLEINFNTRFRPLASMSRNVMDYMCDLKHSLAIKPQESSFYQLVSRNWRKWCIKPAASLFRNKVRFSEAVKVARIIDFLCSQLPSTFAWQVALFSEYRLTLIQCAITEFQYWVICPSLRAIPNVPARTRRIRKVKIRHV
jgi:hypothetical protein